MTDSTSPRNVPATILSYPRRSYYSKVNTRWDYPRAITRLIIIELKQTEAIRTPVTGNRRIRFFFFSLRNGDELEGESFGNCFFESYRDIVGDHRCRPRTKTERLCIGLNIRAYGLPTATFIAGWITYLRMKKLLPTSSSTTFQLLFSDVNPRDMGKFFFFI